MDNDDLSNVASVAMVLNYLMIALAAGLTIEAEFQRISQKLRERHAAGEELTTADLLAGLDANDAEQAGFLEKARAALLDPNTPAG